MRNDTTTPRTHMHVLAALDRKTWRKEALRESGHRCWVCDRTRPPAALRVYHHAFADRVVCRSCEWVERNTPSEPVTWVPPWTHECAICGDDGPTELHHVVPRKAGGSDDRSNLIRLCVPCHHAVHANYNRAGIDRGIELLAGAVEA